MTTIKATCPVCGEVELTPEDLQLMVCRQAELSYYAFRCPHCLDEVRKPADEQVVSLLVSGGVRPTPWSVPEEALETHTGPRITYDDVLDFALALDQADLLAPIASQVVSSR
jgi:hypothetical protein